jgi:MraZ protein
MLIGQYEASVSNKHQTALPKKFREILGRSLIITKGFEKCLIVVAKVDWKTLLEGTEGRPFTNKSTRSLQRFLLGNATDITLDDKGRFVIPEYLRKFAGVGDEIVFAGLQRFVEVWDKKAWEEHQNELNGSIESIADRLSGGEGNDN